MAVATRDGYQIQIKRDPRLNLARVVLSISLEVITSLNGIGHMAKHVCVRALSFAGGVARRHGGLQVAMVKRAERSSLVLLTSTEQSFKARSTVSDSPAPSSCSVSLSTSGL